MAVSTALPLEVFCLAIRSRFNHGVASADVQCTSQYQISAKLDNVRLSYCALKLECHVQFERWR